MMKKFFLLMVLVFNFAFIQSSVYAKGEYADMVYMRTIKNVIQKNWIIPKYSDDKSAIVSVSLDQLGHIVETTVIRSSNCEKFDRSALDSLYKSICFGRLPNNKASLTIEIYFSPDNTIATIINPDSQLANNRNSNIYNISNIVNNNSVDFSQYTNDLGDKVNSNWVHAVSKKLDNAVASVKVGKDGSLQNIIFLKPSKDQKFNKEIFEAISKTVPLDSLPKGFNSDYVNVKLTFNACNPDSDKTIDHYVVAEVNNIVGYDDYVNDVKKVINSALQDKRFYFDKDLLVEISINSSGQVKYVKVQDKSKDKNFDDKILALLQKTSFPAIPGDSGLSDITLNFEIVTNFNRPINVLTADWLLHFGARELKLYCP